MRFSARLIRHALTGGLTLLVISLKTTSDQSIGGNCTKARHDGLCEYISRAARVELVHMLVRSMGSTRKVAKRLGVSNVAVYKWLHPGEAHPSNTNLQKIVGLAVEFDDTTTSEILENDLHAHQTSFERFTASIQALTGGLTTSTSRRRWQVRESKHMHLKCFMPRHEN